MILLFLFSLYFWINTLFHITSSFDPDRSLSWIWFNIDLQLPRWSSKFQGSNTYLIFVISFTLVGFSKTKFYAQKTTRKAPKTLKMFLKKSNICVFSLNLEKFTPDTKFLHRHTKYEVCSNTGYTLDCFTKIKIGNPRYTKLIVGPWANRN